MGKARLFVVSAILLFLPSLAFAVDRSECKQFGGTTDCWEPVVGQWQYNVCGEIGAFASWDAAVCTAQGGEMFFGNCQNLPPIDKRRPVTESDISPLAQDEYFHFNKPLCEGPSAGPWQWGVPISSVNCFGGNGAEFTQGYEFHNNTNHFPVTGRKNHFGISCNNFDTVISFSATRHRFVGCLHPDDRSQEFTTGAMPSLCTLSWEIPIPPKQCTDCDKSGTPMEVGNPINPVSFVKRQLEVDYAAIGPHPLRFQRLYLSRSYNIDGKTWRHNYSSRINHQTFGTRPVALAHRPNGRSFSFVLSGSDYVPDVDVDDRLTKLVDGAGAHIGWQYYEASTENTETYDVEGKLLSIADRAGLTHNLAYSTAATPPTIAPRPGLLVQVTDAFGRGLSFTYDALSRMISMQDPAGQIYTYTYLSEAALVGFTYDQVTSVTYPDGKKRTYLYNEPLLIAGSTREGRMTGIVDENNARFASYRHEHGFATRTEHAGGVNVYTVANSGGWPNAVLVTDPRGTVRTYGYQKINEVHLNTSITQPAASGTGTVQSTRTYDTNGNLASSKDFNGNRTDYTFDPARNLQTARTEGLTAAGATTPQTRTTTTAWHPTFRLPVQIAEPLRMTTNVYDADGAACGARGALCSRTVQATNDANGAQGLSAAPVGALRTSTYTYNANGQVLTVNGPRADVSDVTTYTYYPDDDPESGKRGNLASVTNAANHRTDITAYNAHGQPLTIVDANGLTTTLTYDERRRLKTRNAGGELTSYDYDGVGQLTKVTLPDGTFLSYSYDAAHRLTGMQDNAGNRVAYSLDAMGNRTLEQVFDPVNALAQTRSRVYSNLNRLFQELGAQSQTTEYGYDDQGNVTSVKDPLLRITANQYDALNRLKQMTDPGTGITQYAYNGLDALTQVTDPRNLVTGYTVNGLGNLTRQASPDTGNTDNTYDDAGNLLTQTDAKGQQTAYAYDALNRVTLITFHDGSRQAYAYDQGTNGIGRLSSITETDPASQQTSLIQYAYTPHGRASSETRTVNGVQYVLGYSYDAAGRLSGLSYPSGRTLAYSFDPLGRVSGVSTTFNGQTQPVVSGVAYHPFGSVKSYTLGNGQAYTRSYDQDGRIGSYTLGPKSFSIGYDAASRIEFINEFGNPANSNNYGYDSLDRLTSAATPGTPYGYGYDAVGNRVSKTAGAATDTLTYGTNNNRIATLTPASGPQRTFVFDPNGSTINDGINTFAYDVRGRMVQATSIIGATGYQVNALGQRIRKTNSQGDTVFHYDTRGRLIAETSPAGALKRELLYLGDIAVGVVQ